MKKRNSFIERELPFALVGLLFVIVLFIIIGWAKKPRFGLHLLKYALFGILFGIVGYLIWKLRLIITGHSDLSEGFRDSDKDTIIDSKPGWLLKDNNLDSKRVKRNFKKPFNKELIKEDNKNNKRQS